MASLKTKAQLLGVGLLTALVIQTILRLGLTNSAAAPIFRHCLGWVLVDAVIITALSAIWRVTMPNQLPLSKVRSYTVGCVMIMAGINSATAFYAPIDSNDEFEAHVTSTEFKILSTMVEFLAIVTFYVIIPLPYFRSGSNRVVRANDNLEQTGELPITTPRMMWFIITMIVLWQINIIVRYFALDLTLVYFVVVLVGLVVIILLDKRSLLQSRRRNRSYILATCLITAGTAMVLGVAMLTVLREFDNNGVAQFAVFLGWGLLMIVAYVVAKMSSLFAVGAKSNDSAEMASILMFSLQLFDDLFTNMIFLEVEPFSVLFFSMIPLFVARDVLRDCGYGFKLWQWCTCRKKKRDLDAEAKTLLFHFHLAEQNLLSELIAVLLIPFIIVVDLIFATIGYGVDTLTLNLSADAKVQLLKMYAVLIAVEVVTHIMVMKIFKRQFSKFSARVRATPASIVTFGPRRQSLKSFGQQWNAQQQGQFWHKHRAFFAIMISFSVVLTLQSAILLKHGL